MMVTGRLGECKARQEQRTRKRKLYNVSDYFANDWYDANVDLVAYDRTWPSGVSALPLMTKRRKRTYLSLLMPTVITYERTKNEHLFC